jgi:hypothetical protein
MILETVICLGVLFFIAVLFYKQANEQFEILQLDADRLDELPTLYSDHSPIVVRNISVPPLGTHVELQKRPHIYNMAVAPNLSLRALLADLPRLSTFQFSKVTSSFLASEAGLPIWVEKHLRSFILPSPFTSWMYSTETSLWPHHRGLFKTTAFQTILLPTQGKANVSLLLESQESYLPVQWKGRSFQSLTPQDTPLLNQIQFMEIMLRKGHMLVLPAHMIVDIQTAESEDQEDVWTMIVELHHPISKLATLRG